MSKILGVSFHECLQGAFGEGEEEVINPLLFISSELFDNVGMRKGLKLFDYKSFVSEGSLGSTFVTIDGL